MTASTLCFEDDTHPKLWERNSNKKFVRSALWRCHYYIKYAYFQRPRGPLAPICSKIVPGEKRPFVIFSFFCWVRERRLLAAVVIFYCTRNLA